MSPRGLPRVGRDPQAGQALVLVAISLVVLLGMAAVAIDAGRFLTQRRFVQNAADAAALAAANVVVSQAGAATVGTARQAARDVLAIDLAGSAVGAPVFAAAEPPVFSGAQIASDLVDGIVLADAAGTPLPDTASLDSVADVRVALSGPVDFTFGRVLGVTAGTVSAKARVGFNGD
ncbi:MAG: pilus assembly protein TadG-related protein, partial [Candidatus Limnocylindrales bacterium]